MRRLRAERRWVRPGVDDDEETLIAQPDAQKPTIEVREDDPEPTGLLDQFGRPIYREREPIGFRFSEND